MSFDLPLEGIWTDALFLILGSVLVGLNAFPDKLPDDTKYKATDQSKTKSAPVDQRKPNPEPVPDPDFKAVPSSTFSQENELPLKMWADS